MIPKTESIYVKVSSTIKEQDGILLTQIDKTMMLKLKKGMFAS